MTDAPSPRCSSGTRELREKAADAIRTFCQSLGSHTVVLSSDGAERIYYSGLSLDALSVAVALALSPQAQAGETKSAPDFLPPHSSDERLPSGDAADSGAGTFGVAQRPTTYVKTLEDLVQCLIDNDPEDLIADGGIRVIDGWRKDAERALAIPSTVDLAQAAPVRWLVVDSMGFELFYRDEEIADDHVKSCGGTKTALYAYPVSSTVRRDPVLHDERLPSASAISSTPQDTGAK